MGTPPVVVVVEDNSELRSALKEALAAEGYRVLAARDEADALEILRANSVDLLITDVATSRGASDLEALGREFPHVPVVAISTSPRIPLPPVDVGRAGRYRTLSRPFRLGELLAASRDVLSTQ